MEHTHGVSPHGHAQSIGAVGHDLRTADARSLTHQALGDGQGHLNDLHEALTELERRLDPVLAQPQPDVLEKSLAGIAEAGGVQGPSYDAMPSFVRASIAELNGGMEHARRRIVALLDRLDV
jgi:hypothetical protein